MASIINFDINFKNEKGEFGIGELKNFVTNAEDSMSRSLTQYIRRSMIASRVFIQREVADEEILPDLLLTLQQMYVGWIMTAMQLNTYIDKTRTIRTALDIVATENFKYVPTEDLLGGLSSFTGARFSDDKERPANIRHGGGQVLDTTTKKELNLPAGRIIEVKFNMGGDPKNQLAVNLYVQLLPTFVPASAAEEFFQMNFKPSLKQRWFQVTSGEKKFFADFLFELDLLKKRNKALKQDTSGALQEMMDRQRNGLLTYLLKLGQWHPEKQNIGNTLHIYEKSSFDRWCSQTNCDFRRMEHRTKFFNRTFSMVVAVIDSAYGMVDIYFHGINNRGEYKFSQLQQQAKTEKYDLQSIMKSYYMASAPKF